MKYVFIIVRIIKGGVRWWNHMPPASSYSRGSWEKKMSDVRERERL